MLLSQMSDMHSRVRLKCDGTLWSREGKWRGNWRMEWVASTLHTTPEHGVSSITTADAHTSAVSSRMNWRPRQFKWIRPFRRKAKCGFCACAITFQTQSNTVYFQTAKGLLSYIYIKSLIPFHSWRSHLEILPVWACICSWPIALFRIVCERI